MMLDLSEKPQNCCDFMAACFSHMQAAKEDRETQEEFEKNIRNIAMITLNIKSDSNESKRIDALLELIKF